MPYSKLLGCTNVYFLRKARLGSSPLNCLVDVGRFELPTPWLQTLLGKSISLILRHGWQPTGTFRYAGDTEVVPHWYSFFDHLRKVWSVYS